MDDFISRSALIEDLKWLKSVVNESSKNEVQDFIDRVESFPKADVDQKWIPVTERLPEMHTKVLCCGIRGGRFIAELSTWGNGNRYWDKRNGKGCPEVTHWMPLPEPPMNVEGKE